MIAAPLTVRNDDGSLKPIRISKAFEIPECEKLVKARLYITAHGCYHATINDQPVGYHCMAPGWQSYKHRLHYQVFDVKELLRKDNENTIHVDIALGWFAGALA